MVISWAKIPIAMRLDTICYGTRNPIEMRLETICYVTRNPIALRNAQGKNHKYRILISKSRNI